MSTGKGMGLIEDVVEETMFNVGDDDDSEELEPDEDALQYLRAGQFKPCRRETVLQQATLIRAQQQVTSHFLKLGAALKLIRVEF